MLQGVPSLVRGLLGIIERPLQAGQVIVVLVDPGRRGQFIDLDVCCRVSDTAALRPFLVTFDTSHGAGQDGAAGAFVGMGSGVALSGDSLA